MCSILHQTDEQTEEKKFGNGGKDDYGLDVGIQGRLIQRSALSGIFAVAITFCLIARAGSRDIPVLLIGDSMAAGIWREKEFQVNSLRESSDTIHVTEFSFGC